ncbi:MAG: hypothetical protein IRY95_06810, partial [Clostridia bacterium]|nr:hypothetical protein [Clostridia bacterium]
MEVRACGRTPRFAVWPGAVALAALGLTAFLFRRELAEAFRLLSHVDPLGVAVAATAQVALLMEQSALYAILFALVGSPVPLGIVVELTLAANLANRLAPVGGAAGAALFAAALRGRGLTPERGALVHMAYYVVDYLT